MGRLKSLPPRLTAAPPRLGVPQHNEQERSRFRDTSQAHRAWYKTSRWQKLRWNVLTQSEFTCRICGKIERQTSQLVCDHIQPHRGDKALFWDEANLQTLCKPCHDTVKQREEQQSLSMRGVWY